MEINDPNLIFLYAIITGVISIIPTLSKQKVGKKTLQEILKAHSNNIIFLSRAFTVFFIGYFIYSIFPRECKAKYAVGTLQIGKIYKPKQSLDEVKIKPAYGIQVFSGDDVCRTISAAQDFKDSPFGDPLIKVKLVNNLKRYALLIGKYNHRETAEEIRDMVTKYYSGKLEYVKSPFLEFYDNEDLKQQEEFKKIK